MPTIADIEKLISEKKKSLDTARDKVKGSEKDLGVILTKLAAAERSAKSEKDDNQKAAFEKTAKELGKQADPAKKALAELKKTTTSSEVKFEDFEKQVGVLVEQVKTLHALVAKAS